MTLSKAILFSRDGMGVSSGLGECNLGVSGATESGGLVAGERDWSRASNGSGGVEDEEDAAEEEADDDVEEEDRGGPEGTTVSCNGGFGARARGAFTMGGGG